MTLDLLPRPRSLEAGEGTVPRRTPETGVDPSLPAEGYRLEISPQRVHLAAADDAGRFYGRATLDQLARGMDGELPVCTITDWPDLPVRGVMLDISRDKVPTTATLEALVDRLASWKVNQLQLYMEHTFAYAGHEQVWAEASPLTAEEVRGLDAFCRQRHVELVPNQNCLGHMGRWLRHERYRPLAVAPDGWSFHGRWRAPTTLDPANPASLALVRELLGQLLPCFTSTRVHVGLDEPFELPPDRIGQYQDFAARIRNPIGLKVGPTAAPEELLDLLRGCGWAPRIVAGDEPEAVHQALAQALDDVVAAVHDIQHHARAGGRGPRPRWPMIVLRTPKGWTGPKEVDGLPVEGTWRAHQVPLSEVRTNRDHLRALKLRREGVVLAIARRQRPSA